MERLVQHWVFGSSRKSVFFNWEFEKEKIKGKPEVQQEWWPVFQENFGPLSWALEKKGNTLTVEVQVLSLNLRGSENPSFKTQTFNQKIVQLEH